MKWWKQKQVFKSLFVDIKIFIIFEAKSIFAGWCKITCIFEKKNRVSKLKTVKVEASVLQNDTNWRSLYNLFQRLVESIEDFPSLVIHSLGCVSMFS